MLDLNQLVIFYQLAKAGSFSKAEKLAGVNQSWISRQIKDLEEKLNNKLFERNYGSVALTSAGEALLESVEKIMFEAKMIETTFPSINEQAQGNIKVATTTGQAAVWLVKYMANFMEQYPDMRISVIGTDERVDLRTQDADVMIRPFVPKSPDLVHLYLSSYPLGLYASQSYLGKFGTPQKAEDLDHHRLIAFSKEKATSFGNVDWHLSLGYHFGERREPFFQVNSAQGLVKVAQDGLGIVSISQYNESAQGTNLIRVLPDINGPMIDIYYIYPKKMQNFKKITVLGEYLVKILEEESKHPNTTTFRRNVESDQIINNF